ncbi:MAG TPA: amino acid ABC transporter permease [Nocardioidaceae bacterium]|nr:amino acid ABC transporter permease [Nocardioidaceae bacterium]
MFDFGQFMPPLIRGALLTIFLCVVSGALGTLIGLIFGIARSAPLAVVRWLAAIYTNFIRGIPILIILLFMYFALPLMFPAATFDRGVTAIVGLSVYSGAYMAEIFRGSIEAIPRGQLEAAEALGMHYLLKMRYVVMPQALKIAVPPAIGFLIALVKASSLVSVIGFTDLTRAGRIITSQNHLPLVTFVIVAALYFIISYPISLFGRWYERRLA